MHNDKVTATFAVPSNFQGLDFKGADYESMAATLAATNWKMFFDGCQTVNNMYEKLVELLHFLIEVNVPQRRVRNRNIDKCVARLTSALQSESDAATAVKIQNRLARTAHRQRVMAESKLSFRDIKGFFRYANGRLKLKEGVPALKDGQSILVDDPEKAEALRGHFASVYLPHLPVPSTLASPSTYLPPVTACKSDIILFPLEVIKQKLASLKPKLSVTPESLPPIFYKKLADVICFPLQLIFERFYVDGVVPDLFRRSIVTPVHKKGLMNSVNNYRPIAQEVVPCLIMEKIVVDHSFCYLASNELLDKRQFGFTHGKSTTTQLLHATHDWASAINERQVVHCVYFDFSKAFDLVNIDILTDRMRLLGFDDRTVRWCSAYLTGRSFRVRVGDSFSGASGCPSGVPQGSTLGPFLWSIYIQSIQSVIPSGVNYLLYADDLKLYTRIASSTDVTRLQLAIDAVTTWASDSRLTLSESKCAVLKTKPCDIVYTVNGIALPNVNKMRDLGVTIDCDLRFREHIVEVARTANNLINLIFRIFVIKQPIFYVQLYRSLIVPRLLYGCEVWSPHLRTDKYLLERCRNRFVRFLRYRCGESVLSIDIPTIESLHRKADLRTMRGLASRQELDHFLESSINVRRSKIIYRTRTTARTDTINNMFAWRCARSLRGQI